MGVPRIGATNGAGRSEGEQMLEQTTRATEELPSRSSEHAEQH